MATNPQEIPFHKLPPQSIEAEQSVLGGILLSDGAIDKVLEILNEEDFYRDSHRKVFKGMVSLSDKSDPIDIITLTETLKKQKLLEDVGGASFISALADSVPTAANITHYARIVKEKFILRKVIEAATEIVTSSYDTVKNSDEFLDYAERLIFEIAEKRVNPSFSSMRELVTVSFKALEKLYENKELVTGVPTGFIEFDRMTSGLQPSELIIIAGRPSMGKTAFCVNMAQYASYKANKPVPVAIFSLEMSKEQLVQRMLCAEARIDSQKLRGGFLSESDWPKLTNAAGALSEAPIFIDDTPAISVLEMRAKARRLKADKGLGLVIVDYLQLMRGKSNADNREQEISDISRSLKALAKELAVPVIALSQLSRRTEQRTGNKPQLSDLRESGSIEQDADVVIFIFREEIYKPCECPKNFDCTCGRKGVADIIIGKQRNGPVGDIKLAFLKKYTAFANLDTTHSAYEDFYG
ncbi:MAG: replicative DNA helicase [Thermodesulfobacteriota bacterium]